MSDSAKEKNTRAPTLKIRIDVLRLDINTAGGGIASTNRQLQRHHQQPWPKLFGKAIGCGKLI